MKIPCRPLVYWGTVFLFLAGAVAALKPGAVWITDNGNKYMMMRNIAAGNGLQISHPVPALFPTGGFHFIKEKETVHSFYPEFLSAFTVPFYKLFGERGILFFPLCATLLLLFLAWRHWHIPPPLLLLSTPLCFYSLLLWEMTPSVFLVTAALLLVLRERFFAAGALLGISLLMREEAYFVCAALGAALLFSRKWDALLKFSAGFLLPASLVWIYQYTAHGHILGKHGKYYYLNNNGSFSLVTQLKAAYFNYFHHLLRFDGWGNSPWNALCFSILPVIAAGAAPGFRKWHTFKLCAAGLYLGAVAILALGLCFQKNIIYASSLLTGFLTATPVMLGFFLNWRSFLRWRRMRLLTLFALFYILGVPPLMTASDVGLIWGARHFMVLMVLCVFLSYCGFRLMGIRKFRKNVFNAKQLIPASAAVLSIAIQLYGLYALYTVSTGTHTLEERLLARPEKVIVTDIFYLPELMPRLFFEKTLLQVITPKDLKELENYFKSQKELSLSSGAKSDKSFLLLLSPDPQFRRMSDGVLKSLLMRHPLTAPPGRMTAPAKFPDIFAATALTEVPHPAEQKKL